MSPRQGKHELFAIFCTVRPDANLLRTETCKCLTGSFKHWVKSKSQLSSHCNLELYET